MIEQHGEEHADELIGIVEAFEDSAAGSAGGARAPEVPALEWADVDPRNIGKLWKMLVAV